METGAVSTYLCSKSNTRSRYRTCCTSLGANLGTCMQTFPPDYSGYHVHSITLCRSMREDPNPERSANEKTFFGDNFTRKTGDYSVWQDMQLHSMQAFDKGVDVNAMVCGW